MDEYKGIIALWVAWIVVMLCGLAFGAYVVLRILNGLGW